jgi:hypothetical protein
MGNLLREDLQAILGRRKSILVPFLLREIPKGQECRSRRFCDSCVGTAVLENGDFRVPSQHKCDITELYCSARKEVRR